MKLGKIVTAIAVAVVANFVTHSWVHAEEGRDDSSDGLNKSLEEMAKKFGNSIPGFQEKLNKYRERLKNMKPSEFGFSDDKMYPEEELTRDVREIQFPADSITQIRFSKRLGKDDIRVVKSQDDTVTILITVLADPEHKQLISSLSSSLQSRVEGQKVVIFESNSSYGCITVTTNGALKIKGACYTAITVAMPEGKNIAVYNDNKRIYGPAQAMTVTELIDGLGEGFSSDKLKLIETFKSGTNGETKLTSKEMEKILEKFSFDNEKLEALKKLVSFLDPEQKEAFSERISEIITFDRDQKKAYQILLRGR